MYIHAKEKHRRDLIRLKPQYLDSQFLDSIAPDCSIKPYTFLQCLGEVVLIPVGCAHQVSEALVLYTQTTTPRRLVCNVICKPAEKVPEDAECVWWNPLFDLYTWWAPIGPYQPKLKLLSRHALLTSLAHQQYNRQMV